MQCVSARLRGGVLGQPFSNDQSDVVVLFVRAKRVHIFDHSIEIINPRRSIGFAPAAQKAIRYGVPQRLNPQLTAIFYSTAYGLSLTRGGLPELLHDSRTFSGRRAEIHSFNDEFRLRFYGV